MSFLAAIFDMDGVVVDTVPLHFKAWKRMADDYGRPFTFDDYKAKVDGIPRIDGARAILEGLPEEVVREAAEKKQGYFLELVEKEGVYVYDSTVALMDELKDHGVKIAVISASKNAEFILKRAGVLDKLDALVAGGEVKRGKPHPDIFLAAASKLSVDRDGSIVFEDAVLGVEAAKRARMYCVGVDRYNDPSRLSKADMVVSDLSEVNYEKLREALDKSGR